jgi:hypothetical protein
MIPKPLPTALQSMFKEIYIDYFTSPVELEIAKFEGSIIYKDLIELEFIEWKKEKHLKLNK